MFNSDIQTYMYVVHLKLVYHYIALIKASGVCK